MAEKQPSKGHSVVWIYLTFILGFVAFLLFSFIIHPIEPVAKPEVVFDLSKCPVLVENRTISNLVTQYQCSDGSVKSSLSDCTNPTDIKQFSGNSDTVTDQFYLNSGLAIFNMSYGGNSNFIVALLDPNGNTQEYLANKVGSYKGSVSAAIVSPGNYRLSVKIGTDYNNGGFSSTAPWSIHIIQ